MCASLQAGKTKSTNNKNEKTTPARVTLITQWNVPQVYYGTRRVTLITQWNVPQVYYGTRPDKNSDRILWYKFNHDAGHT